MPVRFFQFICLLLLANPARSAPSASEQLAAAMTGTFSTTEQARGDQNFRNLTMHATPIWTDRMDGPWLYAEQALSDAPEHPHRQHIYQLIALTESSLELHVFDLPEPIAVTGAWKNPLHLGKLTPVDLSTHQVCTLVFQIQSDGSFKGGTGVQGYASTLRGASFATTEMTVSAQQILLWDRGYNANGTQVWGSVRGGYLFKRIE